MPLLLPLVARWIAKVEQEILRTGTPLTPDEAEQVSRLGVQFPEKIRLLRVAQVPLPDHPILRLASRLVGFHGPGTIGMAFRYGIAIRAEYWDNAMIRRHECVHTGQYERLGGIEPFLREYLRQCFEIGYPAAPLEQEAISKSAG